MKSLAERIKEKEEEEYRIMVEPNLQFRKGEKYTEFGEVKVKELLDFLQKNAHSFGFTCMELANVKGQLTKLQDEFDKLNRKYKLLKGKYKRTKRKNRGLQKEVKEFSGLFVFVFYFILHICDIA